MRAATLLAAMILLAACGQTGALYLPDAEVETPVEIRAPGAPTTVPVPAPPQAPVQESAPAPPPGAVATPAPPAATEDDEKEKSGPPPGR